MNEKVKVIKVELKQEYGEEKLKTYYPEDVELDDIIMSVYSLLNFTSIMFEYSSYQFDLDMSQIKTCLYESKENIENMLQKIDYSKSSHCKNNRKYINYGKCIARKTDCLFYEKICKTDGTIVGVCRPRYDAKKKAKKAEREADIQNTQNLSTYNGRRNEQWMN